MDALELALRCSSLLIRTMAKEVKEDAGAEASSISDNGSPVEVSPFQVENGTPFRSAVPMEMNDSDCERHFYSCGWAGFCSLVMMFIIPVFILWGNVAEMICVVILRKQFMLKAVYAFMLRKQLQLNSNVYRFIVGAILN